MNYQAMFRSLPEPGDLFQKHEDVFRALHRDLPDFIQSVPQRPKDAGLAAATDLDVTAVLPPGIEGRVRYQNRVYVRDESSFDDYFVLDVDVEQIQLGNFVTRVFPAIVDAFRPYVAWIADEEFIYHDFDQLRTAQTRWSLHRVFPITYVSDVLAVRLGLIPSVLLQSFDARRMAEGVAILASLAPMPFGKAVALSDELTGRIEKCRHSADPK